MSSTLKVRTIIRPIVLASILFLFTFSEQGAISQTTTTTDTTINENLGAVPNYWDPSHIVERPNLDAQSIEFLASDDFPPFSFRNLQGNLIGFNVDLARAICIELDLSCSYKIKQFSELERALANDEGDAIIAGISISEKSRRRLLFSDPYLRIPGRFVVAKSSNSTLTPESLAGQLISVTKGTAHEAFLRQFFPDSELASYDKAVNSREALRSRLVTAHFSDALSLGFWLYSEDAAGCCKFAEGAWDEQSYFGPGFAIATSQEKSELIESFNYALKRLYEKGIYRKLYYRYFPAGLY